MKKLPKTIIEKRKIISKFMHRYINGTKGVISLFLAIIIIPFVTIAGSLVNAARINSAVAIFDEALCNASNSTLGTYDKFLRKRFGLLAMSQEVSSNSSAYTTEQLISDTFTYYMKKNLSCLSNTYTSSELEATGVYPLADTNVLLSQIYESGKYTVPTKLVIDGFSLDDILKKLTQSTSLATSICNSLSAGSGLVDSFSSCKEKLENLTQKTDDMKEKKAQYEEAYRGFKAAVETYNSLIDEMNQKISELQVEIQNKKEEINTREDSITNDKEKIDEILLEIEDLQNEKDENGNLVDNNEKIEQIKKDNKELFESYDSSVKELESIKNNLDKDERKLQDIKSSYEEQLERARTNVTTKKEEYIEKIDSLATAVLDSGDAVVAAQNSITALSNSALTLVSNVSSTVAEGKKAKIDSDIETIKKNRKAAIERGDNTAAYLWADQAEEAAEKKIEVSNENTLEKNYISSVSVAISTFNTFTTKNYKSQYLSIHENLVNLKNSVENYQIHLEIKKLADTVEYYYGNISEPISSEEVKDMSKKLASEIASSTFFSVLKALVSFIKAMFTLNLTYDMELTSNINTSYYEEKIGGLPSTKSRNDGSQYSLKSKYQEIDSIKSNENKNLLGGYSENPNISGSINDSELILDEIMEDINSLSECFNNWHWYNVWSNLKIICSSISSAMHNIFRFAKNFVATLATSIYQKALLAGYIGYNISNRTTYSKGSGLTGDAFSLPTNSSEQQGYAFYGAETEYILNGSYSEIENQEKIFEKIYMIRLIYDIGFILINSEVTSIASEAGAATFGIGTIVVYGLYFIAEPLVDTFILLNGGQVPIIKTKIYLTPSGIESLISAFYGLKLTSDQKNEAYKQVINVMSSGTVDESYSENYADAVSAFGTSKSTLMNEVTFDYTKTLIIIMMFKNSNVLLDRLADIIQMEGTYYAKIENKNYIFDLDNSYTYLRASGKFSANEFIKISGSGILNSTNRIVYRGY